MTRAKFLLLLGKKLREVRAEQKHAKARLEGLNEEIRRLQETIDAEPRGPEQVR